MRIMTKNLEPSPYRFNAKHALQRAGDAFSKVLALNEDPDSFRVRNGNCNGIVKNIRQEAARHNNRCSQLCYHLATLFKTTLVIPGLTKFIRWLKGNDRANRRIEAIENMACGIVKAANNITPNNFNQLNHNGVVLFAYKDYTVHGINYVVLKDNKIFLEKVRNSRGIGDYLYHSKLINKNSCWFRRPRGTFDSESNFKYHLTT